MRSKLFIVSTLLWGWHLFASPDDFLQKYVDMERRIAQYYNLDRGIFRAVVEAESVFNRYALLIRSTRPQKLSRFLENNGVPYKKNRKFFSIFPKDRRSAELCYNQIFGTEKALKSFGVIDYDAGLMQINKSNFSKYGLDKEYYLDFSKNMIAGGYILKDCFEWAKRFGRRWSVIYGIECYNKGTNVKKIDLLGYGYAKKVLRNYARIVK